MQQTKIKIFGEIKNFLKTFLRSFFEYNSCRMTESTNNQCLLYIPPKIKADIKGRFAGLTLALASAGKRCKSQRRAMTKAACPLSFHHLPVKNKSYKIQTSI